MLAAHAPGAMRKPKTIGVADLISTCLLAHLDKLDAVPIFIFAPVTGATLTPWLDVVGVGMPVKLSTGSAFSASAMGFHSFGALGIDCQCVTSSPDPDSINGSQYCSKSACVTC